MSDKKPTMIQSERGSVFSVFSEEELKEITLDSGRKVAVSGKINNPGIIDVPNGATLHDIIELCGGILNKSSFKAAQLGIPFGGFLTKESLDKELDFNLFDIFSLLKFIFSHILKIPIYLKSILITK